MFPFGLVSYWLLAWSSDKIHRLGRGNLEEASNMLKSKGWDRAAK